MKSSIRPVRIEHGFAWVTLTKGYTCKVDLCDYDLVKDYNWWALEKHDAYGSVSCVYAMRTLCRNGAKKNQRMHRILTNADDDVMVDHRDGDGLNNTRQNLRFATRSQNQQNKGPQKSNKTGVKGVYFCKIRKKYRATINANKKFYDLGRYEKIEDAEKAYIKAMNLLHQEFGRSS